MGNHQAGRAMGLTAEAAVAGRKPGQTALEILDWICRPYHGCDAEFEASDPDRPGCVHPRFGDYTSPHPEAALGMLMLEAFAPVPLEDAVERYRLVNGYEDDADAAEHERVTELWWREVYEPFNARYSFC